MTDGTDTKTPETDTIETDTPERQSDPTLEPEPEPTRQASGPHERGYDEPRNVRARIKGLPGEVIEGGTDPDPAEGLREERYYGRLLVGMVAALILGGFVVGLAIALAQS